MNFLSPSLKAWSLITALLIAPCVQAQETDDPFLDAMLGDMKQSDQEAKPVTTQTDASAAADAAAAEQAMRGTPEYEAAMAARRELEGDSGIFSNELTYEGRRVSEVLVRRRGSGVGVTPSRLRDVISTREGMNYSSTRVNADLERLIQRGLADGDTRVAVEPTSKGLRVIFEVAASQILGGVAFTGNHLFKDKALRDGIKLKSGHVINDRQLSDARTALIKMYNEARYPDARVSWRQVGTAREGYRDIVFDIYEGARVNMNAIKFVGNRQFDAEQLRQVMETKEKGALTWFTKSGRIDREKIEDDFDSIIKHYRNFGYLRAQVTKVDYRNAGTAGNQKLLMTVHIYEGPRYRVRNISFRGTSVYSPKQLEPGLSMLGGDIYSLQKVSDDITMIRRYYGVKGYADADVRPDVSEVGTDGKGTRLVDLCYEVNEGGRFAVGRINLRGNTKTKPHVILRELPIKSGEYLNSVDLETARKRLMSLNYFEGVEVSQAASGTPGYRDINVSVAEKMTGSAQFGVAFSSVQNAYLYTTITQSNFDIRGLTNGTFVGGGQRLTLSGKLGTEFQSGSIFLLEPWFLDRRLAFSNELFFSNSSYMSDYYDQVNFGWATSLRYGLTEHASVKLEYRLEQYNLDEKSNAPLFFQQNCGDFTRSHIEISYNYDTRDAVITPRSGGHIDVGGGWSGPGSTVQTYNVGVSGSYYYNSFWDSIWSVNFAAETVDTVKSDEEVPLFERCYLGGPTNLRGFRYRDVGMVNPALAGDETMGGRSSAYVQLEVTVPLMETIRLAFFVDAGFVHEDSFDFSGKQFAADYGFGLRMNLPMGPLAVDYAIPFKSENAVDKNGQFQFYVDYKY